MSKPAVILLAAGKNSRFFPLNASEHKAFSAVCDVPLAYRTLANLAKHGYTEIHIVVSPKSYLQGAFYEYLQEHPVDGLSISFHLQNEALGQGNALLQVKNRAAQNYIIGAAYYTQLGAHADALSQTAQLAGVDNCIWVSTTDRPQEYGIITPTSDGMIAQIEEKPQKPASQLRINSVYLLQASFFTTLAEQLSHEHSFEHALDVFVKSNKVAFHEGKSIGSLKYSWHLLDQLESVFATLTPHIAESAQLHPTAILDESRGPIVLAQNTQIGAFTKLVGPLYIGANTRIGDHCLVRASSVGKDAVVGAYTELIRSLVQPDTTMHQAYIADSIISAGVKIGAGFITANKRFDRETIKTKVKNKKVDTARKALGAIIGPQTVTGIKAATLPGVLIAQKSTLAPGELLTKNKDSI